MVLSKTLSQVVYYKSNSQFYEVDPIKIIGVDGGDFGRAKGGGGGRGGMSCSIFSSKVITFSRKNSNFVLLGYFCEFINKSDTSGNTLNSKFSRGFLWDKIFLVD